MAQKRRSVRGRVAVAVALALIAALFVALNGSSASAQVPGTNGLIAFDRGGDLFSVRPDGTGETSINSQPAFDHSPSWSPDGTKVAFVRIPEDVPGENALLYIMDANGGNVTRMPSVSAPNEFEAIHLQPAWSPDGSKIAVEVVTGVRETSGIFVMGSDGSNVTQLTREFDDSPAWSPDGTKIAVSRGNSIVTMNSDGTDPVVRVEGGEGLIHESPTWSPDGSAIAYSSRGFESGRAQIRINDGVNDRAIFDRSSTDDVEEPEWSPDGTSIAFAWNRRIYTMTAAGGSVTQIAERGNSVVGARAPSWARAGSPSTSRCERFSSVPIDRLPPQIRRDIALVDLGLDQPVLCVGGRLIIDLSRLPVRLPIRLEVGDLLKGGTKFIVRPPGKETGPPAGETLPKLPLDGLLKQKNQAPLE